MCKLFVRFCMSLWLASNCLGATIYVDVNGQNDPGTGSYGDPFRKIEFAIEEVQDGDVIEVWPGIYTGLGNYNLDPNGLAITIRSTDPNDTNVVASTIIDPNQMGRGFYFHNSEDANCVIAGLTIRNASSDFGSGIYCNGSSPTIVNCIITDNFAGFYGGGVYCVNNSSTQLVGCIIRDNEASDGGGIASEFSNVVLTNCLIYNNLATRHGGGMDGYNYGNLNLINCTVAKNSSDDIGGAICLRGSDTIIKNGIFWNNEAGFQPSSQIKLLPRNPPSTVGSTANISYSNLQGGQTGISVDTYCSLIWDSQNNIDIDPNFASFDPSGDADLWNFHLRSTAGRWDANIQDWVSDVVTSPCVDAADPESNWAREPWPNGKRTNMGAYGGTSEASKNGNIADFDVSGIVDIIDLNELSSKWLEEQGGIVNLDLIGRVDFADFAIFADNWLWKKE